MLRGQTKVLIIGGLVLGMSVVLPVIGKVSGWFIPIGAALFLALVAWAVVAMLRNLKVQPRRRSLTATVPLDLKSIRDNLLADRASADGRREPWYR